jgi:glutathione synthase/RimK-type ligase-like ATP-grasp enzyme
VEIAIHQKNESFSDRWIEYCKENNVPFKIVNCYDNDIVKQIEGCSVLLWHWDLFDPKIKLLARQLTITLENADVIVFPSTANSWHYDDKIGQKYLLESVGAPLVPTYIFYSKESSINCLKNTEFPKVFKLSTGSGSSNVRLLRSKKEALSYCRKAFGRGFKSFSGYYSDFGIKINKLGKIDGIWPKIKKAVNFIQKINSLNSSVSYEKGYIYFQDYIPNNQYDTRITIICDRAFGFIRRNRNADFRASGSGKIIYDPEKIEKKFIKIAFDISKKINAKSLAFDFLKDEDGSPKICEISYCYVSSAVYECPGYWSNDLTWNEGHFWPEDIIIEEILKLLRNKPSIN